LGGANSGDFAIAANNCVGPVLADANCVVSLTFGPTGSGPRSGTLTLTVDAANSPQTMNLVGTGGVAAQIDVVPGTGSTTASVTAGQTAQFNLQVTPGSGFSGTVTFACSGAPLKATCTAPASVAVGSGAASNFTVTVTTSASAGTRSTAMPAFPGGRPSEAYIVLSIVSGLALFFVYAQQHRFRRCLFGAAAMLLVILSGFAGCGSASSTSSTAQAASTGTPSGVYTITITPTAAPSSNPKQQFSLGPFALTLTVN
jgi:hypothetical protein